MEVFHARTGEEAIRLSDQLTPDLLILDLILPELDGFAVVDWLREQGRLAQTPVIVYSARDDLSESDRHRLMLGPTEFFTKSRIQPELFEARVVNLLERFM